MPVPKVAGTVLIRFSCFLTKNDLTLCPTPEVPQHGVNTFFLFFGQKRLKAVPVPKVAGTVLIRFSHVLPKSDLTVCLIWRVRF